MLNEQEFHAALEHFVIASREGTYEEWHEAMHLLAVHASPEQWQEVIGCLRRGEHSAGTRGLARPERITAPGDVAS
jgi:hypothetical protein